MADQLKDGGPAFPTAESRWVEEPGGVYRDVSVDIPGMSLRAYLAGQALAGLCAGGNQLTRRNGENLTWADAAVDLADELLRALSAPTHHTEEAK